jgi:predicted RNase H-like HicB family nuclease
MRVEVIIYSEPTGGFAVEIPSLCVWTQGETLDECHSMAKDAVVSLLTAENEGEDFGSKVVPHPENQNRFTLEIPFADGLKLMMKQLRAESGKSLSETVEAMGKKSKNAYAQYEQGTREPGIRQFDSILSAMGMDLVVSVRPR